MPIFVPIRARAARPIIVALLAVFGPLVTPSSGRCDTVYALSFDSGDLVRYDSTDPAGTLTTLSSGQLESPAALALGPDGNLYIGTSGDGVTTFPAIRRYEISSGTLATVYTFPPIGPYPGSLAFQGNNLLVGRNTFYGDIGPVVRLTGVIGGGAITESDFTSGTTLASSPGLALAADGTLYVSDQSYSFLTEATSGPVKRFDASGAYVDEVIADGASGLAGPAGLVLRGGTLFTGSVMNGAVLRTDLGTGGTEAFASTGQPLNVGKLAGLSDGGLLAASPSGNGSIYRFASDGTLVETFASGLGQIGGLVTTTAVPEPGTLLLAAAAVGAAGGLARRIRRSRPSVQRDAMNRPRGLTLIEVLVVVALIGVLAGVLLPSLQVARESARRGSCANNIKQLGLALANYESARGELPSGAESREWAENPNFPHQFFRWSALAHLAPYYEEQGLLADLDLTVPLYTGFGPDAVAPQNKPVVSRTVPLFLCPSDIGRPVSETFGPTNYAVCTGSGGDGGTPFDTDGLFFINSRIRAKDVADGLSKTVALSESILGQGQRATTSPAGIEPTTGYSFTFTTPLSEIACARPFYYNFTDLRGFSWANGEYRTTLYNHAREPNAASFDCLAALMNTADKARMYAGYGWRTARSRHAGGVTVGMADGGVRFVADAVAEEVWRASATRAGGEAVPLPR